MLENTDENKRFCRRMGMKTIMPLPRNLWNYNKESVSQMINMIEVIYKNCNDYDAYTVSATLKKFFYDALRKFYGIK